MRSLSVDACRDARGSLLDPAQGSPGQPSSPADPGGCRTSASRIPKGFLEAAAVAGRRVTVAVGTAVDRPIEVRPGSRRRKAEAGGETRPAVPTGTAVAVGVRPVAIGGGAEGHTPITAIPPVVWAEPVDVVPVEAVMVQSVASPSPGAMAQMVVPVMEAGAVTVGPRFARRRKQNEARKRRQGDRKTFHGLNSTEEEGRPCGHGRTGNRAFAAVERGGVPRRRRTKIEEIGRAHG